MPNFLLWLLGIASVVVVPALSFRWIKEVGIQVFIISTLAYAIWKKNKFLSLFLMWCVFLFFLFKSYFVNDSDYTGTTFQVNLVSFFNIINIVLYGLIYYILHEIKLNKEKIFRFFCILATFQALYVILQKCQIDQFFFQISSCIDFANGNLKNKLRWPVGTFGNEALVSWFIAILSPYFLFFKEFRYKIGYVLCGIAVLCTKVSAGILGFGLGFLFYLFFKNRKLAIILTIICILTCILLYATGKFGYYFNTTYRFEVWSRALKLWDVNQITGWGNGSFRIVFWEKFPEFRHMGHWAQAHNEYLQVLFEQGIIGLALILGLMWTTFYRFWKTRVGLIPITSLVVFSLVAFIGFPMRTSIGILPIISLVLFERAYYGTQT